VEKRWEGGSDGKMASTHQEQEEKANRRGATPAAKSGFTPSL
jgi:hypothetical protein